MDAGEHLRYSSLILLGHGGGQHKTAPGTLSRARRYAAEGFAVVAIDAPNHGDRPKDGEFRRIAAKMRAGMAAGENPGAPVAGMHSNLAGQVVADWQAVLTAVQRLDQVGVGPVGYCGMSMGCGLGIPLIAAEPRIRAAVQGLLGVHGVAEHVARITVPVQFLAQWTTRWCRGTRAWPCSTPWPRLRKRRTPTPASTGMCRRSKWTVR
ncbi:dienelactone hydrolase family protein [Streptomyces sp. YGL11-2]|uniref:dienelactone hydrolase family protein n=1 Tax=Streptomyces sp. YGL11-2 TaxID=3414028 RepID=UPI003CF9B004